MSAAQKTGMVAGVLVAAGALCIFALAVIGYLDHVNTG